MTVTSFIEARRRAHGDLSVNQRQCARDFFAIATGATAVAAGFFVGGELIIATAFAALSLGFYGCALTAFIQSIRYRRMAVKRRLAVDVRAGGRRVPPVGRG